MPQALRWLLTLVAALAVSSAARASDLDQVCDPPLNNVTHTCVIRNTKLFPPPPAQSTFDIGDWNLRVASGATVNVAASVTTPGVLTIKSKSLFVEAGASVVVAADLNGNGGHVSFVTTDAITVDQQGARQGLIDASASKMGGTITLQATGDVMLKGLLKAAGTPGSGGEIDVNGAAITVSGTGVLQTPGGIQGVGGSISVIGTGPVQIDSPMDATGTLSGGSLDLESNADLVTTANALLNVTSVDSGGDMLFDVRGSVTIGAKLDLSGKPGPDFGGSGGEIDMLVDGDININAPIDLSGTPPDGGGGLADIEANGSINQAATALINATGGNGVDSGGGDVSLTAGVDLLLGPIDGSGGGFGGGSIDLESSGVTTVAAEVNADGTDAGDITFVGKSVSVQALAHAYADVSQGGAGGTVSIQGCGIDVPAAGTLDMTGSASGALLQTSGTMTIGGKVTATGPNSFQYLSTVPVILGSAVIAPPTTPVQNLLLPTCDQLFPTTTTTLPGATTTTSTSVTTTSTLAVPTTTSTTLPGATTTSTLVIPTTSSTTSTTSTSTTFTTTTFTTTSSTVHASTSSSITVTTTSITITTTSTVRPTTTSSTSTTSTIPECTASDVDPCNDGDACTTDSCVADKCVHDPKGEIDGVACRLETLNDDVTAAGSANLGGAGRFVALRTRVSKARTFVEASRTATGRKHFKKLKAASAQMKSFTKLVTAGKNKNKIAAPLADHLLDLSGQTTSRLQALLAP